jgi:hypothetical protein
MNRSIVAAAALIVLSSAPRASAQAVGFIAGAGLDPSQAYVGTHFESAALGGGHIYFRPGIDGTFGGGVSDAIINVLFMYKFQVGPFSPWSIYQATGPVVTIERFAGEIHPHGGLGGVFGVEHKNGFFFEFKVSGGGGPNLLMGVGYSIRRTASGP